MARHRHEDDPSPQPSGPGPFRWGFSFTCGVIAAIAAVLIVLPLLCLGIFGLIGYRTHDQALRQAPAGQPEQDKGAGDVVPNPLPREAEPPPPPTPKAPEQRDPHPAKPEGSAKPAEVPAPPAELGREMQIGEVKVEAIEGRLTPILLRENAGAPARATGTGEPLFVLKIRIHNLAKSKKLEYRGWRDSAKLGDSLGNGYAQLGAKDWLRFTPRGYGALAPDGQLDKAAIDPGGSLVDLFVFEKPVPQAAHLLIALPAGNVGEAGEFRLKYYNSLASSAHKAPDPAAEAERAKRLAEAERKRTDEEAAKRKQTEASAAQRQREEDYAAAQLKYAKKLIDEGDLISAKERLMKVVNDYPDTKAAPEARELLKTLHK